MTRAEQLRAAAEVYNQAGLRHCDRADKMKDGWLRGYYMGMAVLCRDYRNELLAKAMKYER